MDGLSWNSDHWADGVLSERRYGLTFIGGRSHIVVIRVDQRLGPAGTPVEQWLPNLARYRTEHPDRAEFLASSTPVTAETARMWGYPMTWFDSFAFGWEETKPAGEELRIPAWFPLLLSGILPGCWLLALRRRRNRRALGQCLLCGYDLRASKDRCPECGTAIVHT